jgi:bifunctional NMN adenylyltransferase/nudix hydrolase
MTNNSSTLGVIIGRFQVSDLHSGHVDSLSAVGEAHARVLVLIGVRDSPRSDVNPLPYQARRQNLIANYPEYEYAPIADHQSDAEWVKSVDRIIDIHKDHLGVKLYGSRFSCLNTYKTHGGKYPTVMLDAEEPELSGSESRRVDSAEVIDSLDFRKGIIWAENNKYPACYHTVDVAVMRYVEDVENPEVLLCRKPGVEKFQFIGGYINSDETSAQAAVRELQEETGLHIWGSCRLIGEYFIDDWRVADSDKIKQKTFFYKGNVIDLTTMGPRDDIEELKWFRVSDILKCIIPTHYPLAESLFSIYYQ